MNSGIFPPSCLKIARNNRIFCWVPILLGLFFLFSKTAFSGNLTDILMTYVIVTCDEAKPGENPLITFEDIQQLKNIQWKIKSPGAPVISLSWLKQSTANHVKGCEADSLFNYLSCPKALLQGNYDPGNNDLTTAFFDNLGYIQRSSLQGTSEKMPPPPFDEPNTNPTLLNSPGTISYALWLDSGWDQVGPFSLPQQHLTCEKSICPVPCPDPPCTWIASTPPIQNHSFDPSLRCYVGNEIYQRILDSKKSEMSYTDLGCNFSVILKDRTPPFITELPIPTVISEFPTLGGDPWGGTKPGVKKATTGDWYQPDILIGYDNSGGKIYSLFGIADRKDPTENETWRWIATYSESLSGQPLGVVSFLPNDCLGEMKYTVYVWDQALNLNEGYFYVADNRPDIGYGIPGVPPLGDTVDTAVDFPTKVATDISTLDINKHLAEGKIKVDDNDWPNLLIKILSKKDAGLPNSELFFPVPAEIASLKTIDPNIYMSFVANPYYTLTTDVRKPPYYAFLDADLSNCQPGEASWKGKFFTDPDFIRRNFGLENYLQSDNDVNGNPIDLASETFVGRNGFGKSAVVFCTIPMIEDVEYEISLWAEDNVKWLSNPPSIFLGRINPPFTGIRDGKLEVVIPNIRPPFKDGLGIDGSQFVSGPIRAIFREPTVGPILQVPEFTPSIQADYDSRFPFVKASVSDFRGNQRTLKVYFTVSDEKTRIRVLEEKFKKN
ncbi:MAG: hypothetical protein HQM08_13170 [Candidatus Riflebacteria bacterium]|nr:hypothetical protein [Candidatus Riflebacteria bacterium]